MLLMNVLYNVKCTTTTVVIGHMPSWMYMYCWMLLLNVCPQRRVN